MNNVVDRMKRTPVVEQEASIRAKNFEEVCLGYDEERAFKEANRCLGCKNPKCVSGCPVSIDIPGFISKLKENNIEYSIHGVGGCTCCGLELRQEGKSYPTDKILEVINGYLKNHWIYVQENKYQSGFLTVHSKFDKNP